MRSSLERLLDFCKKHKRNYIYGAGNYGKLYARILAEHGIAVSGFIISNGKGYPNEMTPIYSLEDGDEFLGFNDGIIPAYTDSNVEDIVSRLNLDASHILDMDHKEMLCIADEIFFFPIQDDLDKEFGISDVWDEDKKMDNLLVIRIDAIGDLIFISTFLRELKRIYQQAKIEIVVRKDNYDLIKNCPYIDTIYTYESVLTDGELSQQCKNIKKIRDNVREFSRLHFSNKEYDAVFLPRELLCGRNMLDDLLLAYYSGAKYRFGHILLNERNKVHIYERMKKSFTHIAATNESKHEVQYSLGILTDMGFSIRDEHMELWPSDDKCARAKAFFADYSDRVIIALGIMATAPKRVWGIDNYINVINRFCSDNKSSVFVMFGGGDATELADTIKSQCADSDSIIDLTGKLSLSETGAYMSCCDLYVGSNTGLLHFASAFGKPSVTIYSELEDGDPMDGDAPERMGAWQVPHVDLIPPAGLDGCHGVCRMHYSHCINQITPGQVIDAINRLIN